MRPELIRELHRIRNEVARGKLAEPAAVAERLKAVGISVSAADLPELLPAFLNIFGRYSDTYYVPSSLLQVIADLVEGHKTETICDPCAGIGAVLLAVSEATHASNAFAFASAEEVALGKLILPKAEWRIGDPIALLETVGGTVDVFAAVLPFNVKRRYAPSSTSPVGKVGELPDDVGQAILVAAASLLSADGVGLFVTHLRSFSPKIRLVRN